MFDAKQAGAQQIRDRLLLARNLAVLSTTAPLRDAGGIEDVAPFEAAEEGMAVLRFMREMGLEDLLRRTSKMLGADRS